MINTPYWSARPSFLLLPSLPYSVMFPSASALSQWCSANIAQWLPKKKKQTKKIKQPTTKIPLAWVYMSFRG